MNIERVRKAQQESSRERAQVALGVTPELGLYADIRNTGDVGVYLKEVVLDWDSGPKRSVRTGLLVATPLPADDKGPGRYLVVGHKNHDLPPGLAVRYVLPRFGAAALEEMVTGPTSALALLVVSYLGEVHRVLGDELQPMLAELARLYRTLAASGTAGRSWVFGLPAKKKE